MALACAAPCLHATTLAIIKQREPFVRASRSVIDVPLTIGEESNMRFAELTPALIGNWRGTKHLYLGPPPEPAIASPSKLSVTPVAGGGFLQFNYDWMYEGAAQAGLLLFGYDEENAASAAWVDSFHMSTKIMSCSGVAVDGATDLLGSYEAPPGPDWGWRITIRSISANELKIVMHNISPEGQEDLAVEIDYTRTS